MRRRKRSNHRSRGGSMVGVIGALSGAGIAIGVPWIMLIYGSDLHGAVVSTVIIIAVLGGGFIALIAAFFGSVAPSVMGRHSWGSPDSVAKVLREIDPEVIKAAMAAGSAEADQQAHAESSRPSNEQDDPGAQQTA